jgi:hypothetical protein
MQESKTPVIKKTGILIPAPWVGFLSLENKAGVLSGHHSHSTMTAF